MEMSIYLAQLFAAVYLIIGVGMLLNKDHYLGMAKDLSENSAFMYLAGILSLIIGLLIVMEHNIWSQDWTVLVTVFGWLALLKGVGFMLFPMHMKKRIKFYTQPGRMEKMFVIPLILGLVFAYFGFMG